MSFEIFLILKFCGIAHASYWWLILFIFCDYGFWECMKKVAHIIHSGKES